jgi:hypothetical protein
MRSWLTFRRLDGAEQRVVAVIVWCLWPANDGACVEIAGDFYTALLGRTTWWESDSVAKTMRRVVLKLRERHEMRPWK